MARSVLNSYWSPKWLPEPIDMSTPTFRVLSLSFYSTTAPHIETKINYCLKLHTIFEVGSSVEITVPIM